MICWVLGWSIRNYFSSVSMVWLMKCVPWSLIRFKGNSNLVIMFSYINLVATSFVQEWTGFASSHLVTYSTLVIMYLAPIIFPCFGKGTVKYMVQVSKDRLGIMGRRGISFFYNGQPTLWQASNWAILFLQSFFIEGHHIPYWRIFLMVVSTNKWPLASPECASSIKFHWLV